MKPTLALACALVSGLMLGLAGPAQAQLQAGDQPPAIETTDWFNHPKSSIEGLKGRVVAYAFVRVNDTDCLFFLETWEDLCHEFALQPVTLLAVTNESPATIEESIEVEEIGVPIVINPSDEAAKAFQVQVFPSVFIQDARGTLSFSGAPGTRREIRDALVEAVRFARLFPDPPKRARGVGNALKKWQLAKAITEIDKELGKPKVTPADKQVLNDIRSLILSLGQRLRATAEYAVEQENWRLAVTALTRLDTEHLGLPEAEGAGAKLAALQERTDLGDEIEAALQVARGERFERDENWKSAVRTYESLAKQYPETQAGKYAGGQAAYLAPRAK